MSDHKALTPEQERLVEQAYSLVAMVAARQGRLPAGIGQDDLESAGGIALMEAAVMYDPAANGDWLKFARGWLGTAYKRVMSDAAKHARRSSPLELEMENGDRLPRPDPKASDPGEVAQARERFTTPRLLTADDGARALPAPEDVARAAMATRAAMYASVTPERMAKVMGKLLDQAEDGDVKSVKLLIDLFRPPALVPPVTINIESNDVR